ncbi:MAG TPA: helix-turn-helix domain-containing protein [Mizugakiibacter sp.]
MKTIGERVREERELQGYHQEDLARAASVSKMAISLLESGTTKNPKPSTIFAVADFLGLHPRWLATGKGPKFSRSPTGEVREASADYTPSRPLFGDASKEHRLLYSRLEEAYAVGALPPEAAKIVGQIVEAMIVAKRGRD